MVESSSAGPFTFELKHYNAHFNKIKKKLIYLERGSGSRLKLTRSKVLLKIKST